MTDSKFKEIPATEFANINRHTTNKYKGFALDFLSKCSDYVFCTSRDESRKGVFYEYAGGVYRAVSVVEVENRIESVLPETDTLSKYKMSEIISNIKSKRYCYFEDFNQEDLINFKNGNFNIRTRILSKHKPNVLSTIQLPYEYNMKAECPLWEKSIERITEGDQQKIDILQEFLGYCFMRSAKYEKSLFLIGEANSGKSTIVEAFYSVLGKDNVSAVSLKHLGSPQYAGNLIGTYANLVFEIPKNVNEYEDLFKTIVSGEPVTVNTKYLPVFTARPFCKLVFAGNKLMHISDTSNAVFRRMLLLELNNVISSKEVDVDWKAKLKIETPGIFNWAMKGLDRLNENKRFSSSDEMDKRINQIKVANNPVLFFCEECVEKMHNRYDHYIIKKTMYDEYRKFCMDYNIKGIVNVRNFNEEIFRIYNPHLIRDQKKTVNGKQERIWGGIRLKASHEREPIIWAD